MRYRLGPCQSQKARALHTSDSFGRLNPRWKLSRCCATTPQMYALNHSGLQWIISQTLFWFNPNSKCSMRLSFWAAHNVWPKFLLTHFRSSYMYRHKKFASSHILKKIQYISSNESGSIILQFRVKLWWHTKMYSSKRAQKARDFPLNTEHTLL